MFVRRSAGALAAAVVFTVVVAGPAMAVIDPPNTLGCHGTAVITAKDGKKVAVTTDSKEIKLPREGTVTFEAGTLKPLLNNHGDVSIQLGFLKVKAGEWNTPNINLAIFVAGSKQLPKALKYAPPGKYEVTGEAIGSTGSCKGHFTIVLSGSPLSNPVGVAALVGTLISLVGLGLATRAR